ncbi:MAG: SAM-dependent methyltransferase [Leptospiraceae bacterium]
MANAIRLDEWLSQQFDLELSIARSYILQGMVSINGRKVHQAGISFRPTRDELEFRRPPDFRNRGTLKIRPAVQFLKEQGLELQKSVCLDIGASHGGFTAALLEQGVRKVYAIDVAYGIFDYELRQKTEVVLLERKNIRNIESSWFDQSFFDSDSYFVVCDVSFLSIRDVLTHLLGFFKEHRKAFQGLFLLKHQFEASEKTESGIIRDDILRKDIEKEFESFVQTLGLQVLHRVPAGVSGRKGNRETFYWLAYNGFRDSTASNPS